jgi:capsular exopolysaccharide synthesis family protein
LTLSQSYQKKVLVIDADLRRPSLHGMFGIANKEGLTTVLGAPDVHRLPVTQVHGNFWLLPAGRPDPNPMSLLTSDAMKQLLADAAAQFDWVVVDTPPVGLMADANLLAAMIDAALIVVNAGSTPYPLVQKAVDAIGPTRVLGVVLNRATRSAAVHDYDYSGYYGYSETEVVKKKRFRFR